MPASRSKKPAAHQREPAARRASAADSQPTTDAPAAPASAIAIAVTGGAVSWVGMLADVTPEQFAEAVESLGGRVVSAAAGDSVDLLVVGGAGLPLTAQGDSAVPAVRSAATLVIPEQAFLQALSLAAEAEGPRRLFTLPALAEILHEPPTKVRAWYRAGLIRPTLVQHGIPRFEFRQVAVAQTLSQLAATGVSVAKLRHSVNQLQRWLPDVTQALQQLDALEGTGPLLVRLEAGELAEPDGQLQMDYVGQSAQERPPDSGAQLRLVVGPASPADWHTQGVDQERHGLLAEAEGSYRRALLDGGPDASICFDLAAVLQAQGKLPAAAERYRQTLELDPKHIEAWNNLGVVLGELGQSDEACTAFQRALRLDAMCAMSHWNLADTLEAMGMSQAARQHWEAYLKLEPADGMWALHARKRLAGK